MRAGSAFGTLRIIGLGLILAAMALPSTALATTSYSFAVIADTQRRPGFPGYENGVNTAALGQMISELNDLGVDVLIQPGDLVNGFESNNVILKSQWQTWLDTVDDFDGDVYVVPGNHDISESGNLAAFQEKFDMPTNGPSGESEVTYTFDHSNSRFVCINQDWENTGPGDNISINQTWLDATLEDANTTSKDHVFVFGHHPACVYDYVYSGGDLVYEPEMGGPNGVFVESLVDNDVDAYFCGHWHDYQSVKLGSDTHQVICPPGGGRLPHEETDSRGYMVVDVKGSVVKATCYGDLDDNNDYDEVHHQFFISPPDVTAKQQVIGNGVGAGDQFGLNLGVDGDYMVIGAQGDDTQTGAAYVYKYNDANSAWEQQAKLTHSSGASGDYYGWVSKIDGDHILITARGDDSWSGSAHFYKRSGMSWDLVDSFAGGSGDTFGQAADISGTVALIGASEAGEAYFYDYDSNEWTLSQTVSGPGDFGQGLALEGDLALITGTDANVATVYVYRWSDANSAWELEDSLADPAGTSSGDYYGDYMAIDGNTIAIGAFYNDTVGPDCGAVYVFECDGGEWEQTQSLFGETGDQFGSDLDIDDDTMIVSGRSENAYIFSYNDTDGFWELMYELPYGDDSIRGVGVDGDTVVYGAWLDDDNGINSGAAYVYDLTNLQPTSNPEPATLTLLGLGTVILLRHRNTRKGCHIR